jgi:hypothetical protein
MSLEEQLEFGFLERVRMQCYSKKQKEEMKALYMQYEFDGDHGPRMKFIDFVERIYILGGFAERFHLKYHPIYFHDSPAFLYKGRGETPKTL